MMVTLVFLSLPADVVLAQGTTVEVNSGNTIALEEGEVVLGSSTAGIAVEVKGLPDLGPGNGLAAFTFDFSWDKDVINVDSILQSASSQGADWFVLQYGLDNINGQATATSYTTNLATSGIILLRLGITAVGNAGDSTSINVIITTLYDRYNTTIPATTVNAPISISGRTPRSELVSVAITPVNPSIALGLTQQFSVIGTYSNEKIFNITDIVAWTSSNDAIATIQSIGEANPGSVTNLAVGTTTITATLDTIYATTTLTVTRANKEEVIPPPPSEEEEVIPVPPADEEELDTTTASDDKNEKEAASTLPLAPIAAPAPPPIPVVTFNIASWWLVGIIIAGVVLLGLALYFLGRKRG